MSVHPLIQIEDLYKSFDVGGQPLQILRAINTTLYSGQFISIMGPSGSGKSTLLYLMGGLDRPSAGSILVNGQSITTMNSANLAAFRRTMVGFVFQSFHLVPTLTALENVALPGIFAGIPEDVSQQRAFQLLRKLKMDQRADHRPNQLSGGQQQRVAIARALFNDPPIIMADEPTGALDSHTSEIVLKMLRTLCTRYQKTVIVVTHDASIERYADRMIQLRDGMIIDDYVPKKERTTDVSSIETP